MNVKMMTALAGLAIAASAKGQDMPAPPPPPPAEMDMHETRLDSYNDFQRMVDKQNFGKPGLPRGSQPVPIVPQDVKAGADVRDSRGILMAKIEKVGDDYAVLEGLEGGRIEIDFASLAKNNKGLLVNMRKSKFDAMIGGGKK